MRTFGGDWTTEKLGRVKAYLDAYRVALSKQPFFRLLYIDAFAGTGYRYSEEDGEDLALPELAEEETQAYLAGSARLALEVDPPFSEYIFIEKSGVKIAELRKLKAEFLGLSDRIKLIHREANSYIQELCDGDWSGKRAVMFLDPYGMQVNWDSIRAIAETKAIDLWYLFPLGVAVNRLLKRDGNISESIRSRLDELFGEQTWFDAFYEARSTKTLFGEETRTDKVATFPAISEYLVGRLKKEFAGVADNPRPLFNSRNNPLYLLCFAAANPTGAKIAVRIAGCILKQ